MAIGALIIGDEILSGKRQDKHLPHIIETLAARGLGLDYVHYLGDDRGRLTALLRDSFARGDLVFSFGGIGATPDDHTRQAAAAALGVPLVAPSGGGGRARGAVRRGGLSASRADGGVSRGQPHHPQSRATAWRHFRSATTSSFPAFRRWRGRCSTGCSRPGTPTSCACRRWSARIVVYDAGESQLLPLMDDNVARFPMLKLFSLPSFLPDGGRRIELGVRGDPAQVDAGLAHLRAGVEAAGFRWEAM